MKFGVREICDVVLRAKDTIRIGKETFSPDEPVIYFDTAKTSTVEGAATTVYATGGRGNSRLLAWEGERTVTFTMEDALISPMGLSILTGAGLVDATATQTIKVHATETTVTTIAEGGKISVDLSRTLSDVDGMGGKLAVGTDAYGFIMVNGEIASRLGKVRVEVEDATDGVLEFNSSVQARAGFVVGDEVTVMIDFYVEKSTGAQQLEITPDKFAGYYYLEANTLFRRQDSGKDMPAVFVVPKAKIQSAFTFSLASSGDPSTFTFTMDAFPDYTKFDPTKKVLFALQIVGE